MDERIRRIGENEALFREVNERVKEVNAGFGVVVDDLDLVCECGHMECVERIRLTVSEHERIRSDPELFAIRPGHQIEESEDVVADGGDHLVVRKKPGLREQIAEPLDPRS